MLPWAALGALCAALLAAVGTRVGNLPDAGAGSWWFSLPRSWSGGGLLETVFYGALTGVIVAWVGVGRVLRRGVAVPPRTIVAVAAAWSAPLLVGPPIFSGDVYSYVAQGSMVQQGINPYQLGPVALGPGPISASVAHVWLFTPAPYGPLFVKLASLLTGLTGSSVIVGVSALRLLELTGVGLIALFLPRLARRLGTDPARALWIGLLSPVVLFSFVGSSHNDALMVGLLVAGVALALERHPVLGIVVCTLAATVKLPALAGAGFIALTWAREKEGRGAQVGAVVLSGTLAAATMAAVTVATGLGWGWLSPRALSTPTDVSLQAAPVVSIGLALGHLLDWLGLGVSTSVMASIVQVLGGLAIVSVGTLLVWRAKGASMVWMLALAMLVVVLGSPVMWPWYLTWGVVLAAATRAQRAPAVRAVAVLGALIVVPTGGSVAGGDAFYGVALAALAALAWLATKHRWRAVLEAGTDASPERGRLLEPA